MPRIKTGWVGISLAAITVRTNDAARTAVGVVKVEVGANTTAERTSAGAPLHSPPRSVESVRLRRFRRRRSCRDPNSWCMSRCSRWRRRHSHKRTILRRTRRIRTAEVRDTRCRIVRSWRHRRRDRRFDRRNRSAPRPGNCVRRPRSSGPTSGWCRHRGKKRLISTCGFRTIRRFGSCFLCTPCRPPGISSVVPYCDFCR